MTTVFTTAVSCFLCQANVPFSNTDKSRLISHLQGEHMAFFGRDYLIAGCTMSREERSAIQKVVKGRQPKLIQLAPEESEEEVETMEEGQVEAPHLELLEPVTTLEEEEEREGGIRVESVWSEAEGSPRMKTPPRALKCRDCEFTCKLQIQMNRHKNLCVVKKEPGAKPGLSKKWKMKIKPSPVVSKPTQATRKTSPGKKASVGFVKNDDGSIKNFKKDPYASPGKGVPCKECGKEFRNQAAMEGHFEDLHRPGNFPCPGDKKICGKVFTSRNKMSSHYSRNCNPNNPTGAQAIARRRASMS